MRNLAQRKQAKASSRSRIKLWATNAVNGNSHYCCISSEHPTDNWWQVELGAVYDIWEVVVTNAEHCCGMLAF